MDSQSLRASPQFEPDSNGSSGSAERPTWAYWLQDIDIERLVQSSFDLIVIDYSRDGTDGEVFSRSDIAALQTSGKRVLAYFSIGEAEDYRFYWRRDWSVGSPSFIGEENPVWPGNYKVRYWDERWWDSALEPYLQKIMSVGFDGVYVDIVDAFYYWGKGDEDNLTLMADRMVDLILKIDGYAESRADGKFYICIQNGLSIIEEASPLKAQLLLGTISYAALESLFFNTSARNRDYRLSLLPRFHEHGIGVLNVEYIPESRADRYREYLDSAPVPISGLIAAPDRALDTIPAAP